MSIDAFLKVCCGIPPNTFSAYTTHRNTTYGGSAEARKAKAEKRAYRHTRAMDLFGGKLSPSAPVL